MRYFYREFSPLTVIQLKPVWSVCTELGTQLRTKTNSRTIEMKNLDNLPCSISLPLRMLGISSSACKSVFIAKHCVPLAASALSGFDNLMSMLLPRPILFAVSLRPPKLYTRQHFFSKMRETFRLHRT